jgi:hypothetical protein
MKHNFSLLFASMLALLIAFAPATSSLAAASPPEHFRVDVDQTQVLSTCGYPIVRHDVGTLIFQDAFDSNGNIVWENAIFSNWHITFTNLANSKSITSVRAYNERFVQYEDGSFKAMSAGLVAHLVIPGEGDVAANVGVISVIFDASGQPVSIVIGGEHDGPVAQVVCPYLA